MNKIHFSGMGLVLLAMSMAFSGSVTAQTGCEKTAQLMFKSCTAEVKEEFSAHRANCENLSDPDARLDCLDSAEEMADDNSEECTGIREARVEACDLLGEDRYDPDPLLNPAIVFIDPDTIDAMSANSYLSLQAGKTAVLRGGDGESWPELVVVHVTDQKRIIQGVQCRIVVDIAMAVEAENGQVEYEVEEHTDDWYGQATSGDVYYCGELSRNFEDGILDNLDGSFEAGKNLAKAGLLISATPMIGAAHRQEFALGEAEDMVEYLAMNAVPTPEEGGDNPAFPCAEAAMGCLKTRDLAAIDPESTEYKFYIDGIGFVLAVSLEDGVLTGDREELVCSGDSLDVLWSDDCGIDDPEELLVTLCRHAPDAFCGKAGD